MDHAKEAKNVGKLNEKGAAMVTVLMLSMVLLVASAGLMLEVSMNSANVTDAVAEEQAFYAAESGIQSALNVLRGNVPPSPLLDASKPASDWANVIDFKKAKTLATSNLPGDTSPVARLSRWVNYSADYPDRVVVGNQVDTGAYSPRTGAAYKLELIEPDNVDLVTFTTTGRFSTTGTNSLSFNGSGGAGLGVNQGTATVTFNGTTVSNLNVTSPAAAVLGNISVSLVGNTASISEDIAFTVYVNMSAPYPYKAAMRGIITAGTITSGSSTVKIQFPTNEFFLSGGTITLPAASIDLPSSGNVAFNSTISSPEPQRLLVRSVGYGPRGASKILEAVVQKNFFNGMPAPATLTLVGPEGAFAFDPGNSTNTTYSGDDTATNLLIPPIGTTNDGNLVDVNQELEDNPPNPFNGKVIGVPANVSFEMPEWLNNPADMDTVITNMKRVAQASGGYYPSGSNPDTFGNNVTGTGITFVDGDAVFTGAGGGILITTGDLTLHGNFNFKGLIIVLGPEGVRRTGGGTGTLSGNMVIAPYDRNDLAAGFGSPKYDLSGGGNSVMVYNSSALNNGMRAISNFALGVVEK